MAYKMVFDTETTDLNKCFCYDVGYIIYDDVTNATVCNKHFIIEQVWHNLPLFETAYYKEKRPRYIALMRAHKAVMTKWGYAMREMKRDMRKYEITEAYAYNSEFDDKVFTYNCDWYKVENPLDDIQIFDIWGYVSQFITNTPEYQNFCEVNQYFTDHDNYKGNAEIVARFLKDETGLDEAHMGMYDSELEAYILQECIKRGANYKTNYKVEKVLKRPIKKPFTIKLNGKLLYSGNYIKKYVKNDVYSFTE